MNVRTLAIVVAVTSAPVFANDDAQMLSQANQIEVMQTGRYSFVKNIPPVDQRNPLKVVIRTEIPQSAETVGETVNFLLIRSGYVLADPSVLSEEAKVLLSLPLPQVHRNLGPMTLDRALKTLAGEAFELVVDPVHRKVAYALSSDIMGAR